MCETSIGRGDTIRKEHSDGIAIVTKSIASLATEVACKNKTCFAIARNKFLAGETRFEHATDGFGDRDSTVELLP